METARRPSASRLKSYFAIIYALLMHDIKNRFFGSGLGQIVMILWPFVHILVLICIYIATKRINPYGESIVQYSAVSIYPFIIFNYVSRWIVFSAITNKSFLSYPIIKPLDIIISRIILEIISISIVGILLIVCVAACGYDVMPYDAIDIVCAVLGTLFLSVGIGVLNAPFAFLLPIWNVIITLLIILAWVSSGVAFQVSMFPEQIQYYLSFNPLLHCVEWFRSAYYNDYPANLLDRMYVLKFGSVTFTIGLMINRVLQPFYRLGS